MLAKKKQGGGASGGRKEVKIPLAAAQLLKILSNERARQSTGNSSPNGPLVLPAAAGQCSQPREREEKSFHYSTGKKARERIGKISGEEEEEGEVGGWKKKREWGWVRRSQMGRKVNRTEGASHRVTSAELTSKKIVASLALSRASIREKEKKGKNGLARARTKGSATSKTERKRSPAVDAAREWRKKEVGVSSRVAVRDGLTPSWPLPSP